VLWAFRESPHGQLFARDLRGRILIMGIGAIARQRRIRRAGTVGGGSPL